MVMNEEGNSWLSNWKSAFLQFTLATLNKCDDIILNTVGGAVGFLISKKIAL